jgi:CMP-N-acetylneuraminic acid synthetase
MKIFIPIKENSQRVPRKNFRIFHGEPLYKHQLLKFIGFDIFVDTDSIEIYDEIIKDYRLKHVIPYMRSNELKGDKTSVCKLIKDFIIRYSIEDYICQIHVTSPLLNPTTIVNAFEYTNKYNSFVKKYNSVVSVNKIQSRLWRKEEYGYCPINHNPMKLEQTQDLPVYYEENSGFYIFDSKIFIKTGNRIGDNPYFYELEYPENMDIDTEEDWKIINVIP